MRKFAINKDIIDRNYGGFVNPFWNRFKRELKEMLADKAKPKIGKNSITEEVLFVGNELLEGKDLPQKVPDVSQEINDWTWYVVDRICPTGRIEKVLKSPERELLEELHEDPVDGAKQVILVYGHTGHGKTTFLRHFFYHWLSKNCNQKFQRHIVIRVSMGLGGFGKDIENDFDKKVNRALNALFPWLFKPEYLFEATKHQHRNNQTNIDYLRKNFPKDAMLYDMVTWINKFNNACAPYTEDEQSHDFNRLLIEYLTVKYDIDFIFIMDNVDQSPASLQGNFYILARHKLDWITSIDKVVFILGVRKYLLDKVYKEGVVQAYPDPAYIHIFPPSINSYLATRIKSFKKSLNKKRYDVTMNDGKVIDVTKDVLTEMLKKFNKNYSDVHNDIVMSSLSNHDVRQQSKMIMACLRSQAINWSDYIHFLSCGEEKVHFSQHDILRAILRDSNTIVEASHGQLLLNIFSSGTGSDFSNSLNRWYILKLISDRTVVDDLIGLLERLGHNRGTTIKSIEEFLQANIIASPDGFRLREDKVEYLTVSEEWTTIGEVYLSSLPFNLLYVESMAYLTPYDDDLVSEIPIPHKQSGPTFEEFIRASAVLVRQIKRDEKAQLEYIQQHETELVQIAQSNGLFGFGDTIRDRLLQTLEEFKSRNIVTLENWPRLFSYFDETERKNIDL